MVKKRRKPMGPRLEPESFILKNWKTLCCYAFLGIVLIATFFSKFNLKSKQKQKDFLVVETFFSNWRKNPDTESSDYKSLVKSFNKYPEIKKNYQGAVAQILLSTDNPGKASDFVGESISPGSYKEFGNISILIAKSQHDLALEKSIILEQDLKKSMKMWERKKNNSLLFAFNLTRVAILAQMTGNAEEEKRSLDAIISYIGKDNATLEHEKITQEAFATLLGHLKTGQTSFVDYINYRKAVIK